MPGWPSSSSAIASPTGWTKQLIRVADKDVPAAEAIRPAGTKPRRCASRNFASQWARCSGDSAAASARATRARTSSRLRSPFLAYFSSSTSALISCGGRFSAEACTGSGDGVGEAVCWVMRELLGTTGHPSPAPSAALSPHSTKASWDLPIPVIAAAVEAPAPSPMPPMHVHR